MKIRENANAIAEQALKRDNVVSAYKQLLNSTQHNYRHSFVSTLQVYITKLGLVLCECIEGATLNHDTFLGSIEFICKKILGNNQLYNIWRAIDVNTGGNDYKHTIKDIDIDIDLTLTQYNQLISELVKKTKISAFKICYVNKTPKSRDIPLLDEQKHHKYFTVNNIPMQLKVSPDYTIDPYTKKLTTKITLYWPTGRPDFYANIEVTNTHSKRIVAKSPQLIDLQNDNSKQALQLVCTEADLDRRVLFLSVKIDLYKRVQSVYTTGALFWKEYHTYNNDVFIESKTENISQFFKPNQGHKN